MLNAGPVLPLEPPAVAPGKTPPPKRTPGWIPAAVAGLLGLLLGWVLHGASSGALQGPGSIEKDAATHPDAATATSGIKALPAEPAQRQSRPVSPTVREIEASLLSGSRPARIVRVMTAISRLSLEEIPDALAVGNRTGSAEVRGMVRMMVLGRWTELRPSEAAKWAAQQKADGADRETMLDMVACAWAAKDRVAAEKWVETLPAEDRDFAYRGYYSALGGSAPEAGLHELGHLPADEQKELRNEVFTSWAMTDPQAALKAASAVADRSERATLQRATFTVWAERDPRAAIPSLLEMAKTSPESWKELKAVVRSAMTDWGQVDARGSLAALLAMPADVQAEAAPEVFRQAFQTDPEAARHFLSLMPPGRAADEAAALYAGTVAATDPVAAIDVLNALPPGKERAGALQEIASAWAAKDKAAAGAWVLQLPEGEDRTAAVQGMTNSWRTADLAAAATWLQQLAAGPDYDLAASAYSDKIFGYDHAAAADWAATIGDPAKRDEAVRGVVEHWMRSDADAAKAWLRGSHALSPDLRSWLLRSK